MPRTYVLALVSIALGAVGQFVLKLGADQLKRGGPLLHTIIGMFLRPPILAGLVLFGSSFVLWVLLLRDMQLSTAYPMVSLSYVVVTVLSVALLREPVSAVKVAGLALIVAGVVLIGLGSA